MVPLRKHLRANKNRRFLGCKIFENFLDLARATCIVAIQAQNRLARKDAQLLGKFFRAFPQWQKIEAATFRAGRRVGRGMAAVVANQLLARLVESQAYSAIRAGDSLAAVQAVH